MHRPCPGPGRNRGRTTARENQTAGLLPDGNALVAGGVTFTSHKSGALADAEQDAP
ncbi:MAG: hypothetical protein ABSB76_38485 [Streptosporangiaceae bacterium]